MRPCDFCENPVDTDDTDNFVQVVSWVSGPKLDGPKLRHQTGKVAHKDCVKRAEAGQAPPDEQPDLFDSPPPRRVTLCEETKSDGICGAALDSQGNCPREDEHAF